MLRRLARPALLGAGLLLAGAPAAFPGCANRKPAPPFLQVEAPPAYPVPREASEKTIHEAEREYYSLLDDHTRRVWGERDRFDVPMTYHVSYISWPLRVRELRARALRLLWDKDRWESELAAARAQHEQSFVFWVDLYTTDETGDLLGSGENTPWRVFLVLPDGGRIEAVRSRQIVAEKADLDWRYPYHSRFATLWEIEFPQPADPIGEDAAAILEITNVFDTSRTAWHLGRDPGPVRPMEPGGPVAE